MRRGIGAALAAMVIGACSGPPVDEGCEALPLAGTYRAEFVETSGNCGAIDGVDVVLEPGLGPPFSGAGDDCTGPFDFTDDLCAVEFDRACELVSSTGTPFTLTFQGVSTIVEPDRIEGTLELTDGEVNCRSVYDVTWTRR